MTYAIQKSGAEWQALLQSKNAEPVAYEVTRHAATERAFTGKYEQYWAKGSYHCICCGSKLFDSNTKFDAGCGWPSFWKALPGAISEIVDRSHGMVRTETVCSRCGAHLGHVFEDGPQPSGLRYCMNSASLDFLGDALPPPATAPVDNGNRSDDVVAPPSSPDDTPKDASNRQAQGGHTQ
jgi:peptide-methionine (R)-S-oxide reductase